MWLHSSVGRAWHRYRGGHGFESRWSPDFFQASSFQLLKLENLLRWSIFTFNLQPQYKYELFHINFTSFHCRGRYELNKINLAPNVWLHSSDGRASHRYRGGHGFESRWCFDFFRLLLSNFLNWKIYCDDHSSLWKAGTFNSNLDRTSGKTVVMATAPQVSFCFFRDVNFWHHVWRTLLQFF